MNPWTIAVPAVAAACAGTAAWAALAPTAQLFGPTICRTPRASALALTFDDGPNPAITPQLLALLERHRARATFFLVGRWARACPELVREIAARGHAIGNHTDTHPNLLFLPPARIAEELARGRESIAAALGSASPAPSLRLMRPPFGFRGPQLAAAARRAGLRVAMWSLTGHDWTPQPPSGLIRRLARVKLPSPDAPGQAAPALADSVRSQGCGDVILLHDGDFRRLGADRRHVLTALEHWLPRWQDAGLDFVTMDDLL